MYKLLFMPLAGILIMITPGCKDNNSGEDLPEATLVISTDAQGYSEIPSSSAGFNLTVESVMPPAGVKIQAIVKGEIDNINYFTGSVIETKAKTTNLTISNLPRQKICIVTVTVFSKSRSTNSAMTLFRIVQK